MGRGGEGPCLDRSTHRLPYTVVSSCLIYFHLRQKASARPRADERHHAVAIHRAIPLAVEAAVAAPPVRAEERAAPLLALLHRAVLVVGELVLRAHVLAAALEAEDAALAVVARQEGRAGDAEEGLGGRTGQGGDER